MHIRLLRGVFCIAVITLFNFLARKNLSRSETNEGVHLHRINHHFTSHLNIAYRKLLSFENINGETNVFSIRTNRYLLRINLELNVASVRDNKILTTPDLRPSFVLEYSSSANRPELVVSS